MLTSEDFNAMDSMLKDAEGTAKDLGTELRSMRLWSNGRQVDKMAEIENKVQDVMEALRIRVKSISERIKMMERNS